ncbi:hypothetical protein [Aureimonas psammosilenae]|uniref:hypothetical protein n=1 Tax=Aureimonas psammosilenae TaxID=2495496 RepID=UPI001F3E37B0|nr:hypothetical protein [Aureimonas psammosilenae]
MAEYGITAVDRHQRPDIGETRAVGAFSRILRRFGEDHTRLVLSTLAETENNKAVLDEATIWATSDLVRACRQIIEKDAGAWLALWDAMPLGQLHALCSDLSGITRVREAMVGVIYERIVRRFGKNAAQPDLFDDRGPYGKAAR